MSTFRPLPPKMALAFVERGGVENAGRLILDFVAAGVVQTRALVTDIIHADGERAQEWHASISREVWKRIIHDGVDEAMWRGEAIRLRSAGFIDGHREIVLTGIQFDAWGLLKVVRFHNPGFIKRRLPEPSQATRAPLPSSEAVEDALPPPKRRPTPDLSALHSGALHLTVEQTKAALAISHTTFYKLLKAGKLKRAPSAAGTRVMADSVRRYAGLTD